MAYWDVIRRFEQQQAAARAANERRYQEAMQIYERIIEQYEPGGAFGAGYEAQLERTKTRDIAASQQALVSGGLFGTSITAGLPKKWEEEVGQPARLKLEDLRMGRLAEALTGQAGFIERREDIGPDYATIAQLSAQAAAPAAPASTYGQYEPFGQATRMPTAPTYPSTVRTGSAYGEMLRYQQQPTPVSAAEPAAPSWYGPAPVVSQPTPAYIYQGPSGGYDPYGPVSQPQVLTAPTSPFATPYALPSPFAYTPTPMHTGW